MDALRVLEQAIADAERAALPALLGELARLEALARLRLSENGAQAEPAPDIQPREQLIDVSAAAELLDVKPRWLYERADRLPFTRRLSANTLRFSEPGILRWLDTRR